MHRSLRLGVAALATAALVVGLSGVASAAPGSSGSGLQINVLGNTVVVPPTPLVNFPPGGSTSIVSVPGGLASVLSVTANGSSTSANSSATAANANVPTVATATVLGSTCSASPAGTVGNSTLADANVLGIPVAANPPPNTQLAVPGVVTVTLNGQTTTANGLRVRALEVSSNLLASDIVLSESNCGLLLVGAANASRASATTGAGASTAAMPTLAG